MMVDPAAVVAGAATIAGVAPQAVMSVTEAGVITEGSPQTILGQAVEALLQVTDATVSITSTSTETQPLGGGSAADDRLVAHRRVLDLRSKRVAYRGEGGVRVHGEATVRTETGSLEPTPFNPIRIPRIPDFKEPSAPPPPPPAQTVHSTDAPNWVLPKTRAYRGTGGVKVTGSSPMSAMRLQWTSKGDEKIPPRRLVVVGLGGVLVSGAATVTAVSRHKQVLADDDDAIQLLLEVESI
jgi:hypothetical protein